MKNLENKIVDVTEKHRYELMIYQVHTDDFLMVRQEVISEVVQDIQLSKKQYPLKKVTDKIRNYVMSFVRKEGNMQIVRNIEILL